MKLCNAVLFFVFGTVALSSRVDYTGHQVVRVVPETTEQWEVLRHLQSINLIDFWTMPSLVDRFVDIRISPQLFNKVTKILIDEKINHKVQIADLGELERLERQSIALRKALYSGKAIDFENYHTYEEVMAYLFDLAISSPIVVNLLGGRSEEGRDIIQTIISSNPTANKPVIFFDCNIHAREWVTTSTCIWIIDQLTSKYGVDPEITFLVDQYDWKFIPIPNPDGYTYSWTNDRTWRKNRVFNNGSNCQGVDPNRNFPIGFAGPGSSDDPCNEGYHGEAAFSEIESRTIRDLIAADRGRVKAAISVHAFSQLLMSPYASASTLPAEYPEMLRVMEAAVNALTATYGTEYRFGNAHDTLFISSGVTIDHYYENEGIVHSYWIELRDTGFYGYQLPADQIIPTAIETWNGIKALVNAI